jgi:parallel beta-helix repeat protein
MFPFASEPRLAVDEYGTTDMSLTADYTPHDPILITSDGDFETQGWPGSGTVEDPYVIEGLSIDGRLSPSELYCISIEHTQAHFIINGCFLYQGKYGVYLKNVTNGILQHNECTINDYGIYLDKSNNNTILDNGCYYSRSGASWGVYLMESDYNVITDNTCFSQYAAMCIWKSNNNTINNNNCYDSLYGIRALGSDNITIANNNCSNHHSYGIDIWDSNHAIIRNNTCSYIGGGGSAYAISIVANWGPFVHNITLMDNICNNNYDRGIYALDAKDIVIVNNTCNGNYYGFDISDMMYSVLTGNTAAYNSEIGIVLRTGCFFNNIFNNTFGWNGGLIEQSNAEDMGQSKSWDDGIGLGNRWGDYKGVSPDYTIPGSAGSIDHYPMKADTASPVIDSPADFEYESGSTDNSITWTCSDDHPEMYLIVRDGVSVYSGVWDGLGIAILIDGLDLGIYNYTITVTDTCGNLRTDTVLVSVVDTTDPSIESLDDMQYESGTTDNTIVWIASDFNPDSYEIIRNGIQIASGPWDGASIGISVDGLDLGTYNFTLGVLDTSGNNASDTVMVTVVDTTDPSLNTPEDIQFKFGDAGHNLAWMLQDMNPFSYEVFMNSTLIASGTWNSTGETVTIALDGISVGVHFFTIYVTDLAGNEASNRVIVTVLPDSTTTDTIATSPPADSQFQIMDVLGLGIGFGVLLSVIVFVVLRKRE